MAPLKRWDILHTVRHAVDRNFRLPNDGERNIFEKLTSETFRGVEEIRAQLATALVRELDPWGCLEFQLGDSPPAEVTSSVPVEAEWEDADGGALVSRQS